MKRIKNESGFQKAMDEDRSWTTLDCDLTEMSKNGMWYWEIEKTVWHGKGKDPDFEIVSHGTDGAELANVTKVWNNFIDKYTPDEYFVEQNDYWEGN